MKRALHISPNTYKSIDEIPDTKAIWMELSINYDEYHILARSVDNRSHEYIEGKIHLHTVPGFWRPMSFFATSRWGLKKLLKKYKFDIVICQCAIFGGFWAVRNSVNMPVLMEIHGIFYFTYLEGHDLISWILKPIIRYSYEHATMVRSLNECMTERLRNDGIKNKNICEVYNRVNTALFSPIRKDYNLHNPIRLICVGSFVDSKDHVTLFKALKILKNEFDIELVLIGGGVLRKYYEKVIKEYGIHVQLFNRIAQSQITQLMDEADIYVQSSWREAMPRVLLEAMAMKLPIVTTAAGFTEGTIQNGENGLIVPVKNPEKLASAIYRMVKEDSLREKMALKGYKDALYKYDWNVCFDRYRSLLVNTENLKNEKIKQSKD